MKILLDILRNISYNITKKKRETEEKEKKMETRMEINLNENATANHVNHVVVMVIAETEKAFKVERYIESKGKNYTAFIPKKALRNVGNADRAIFMEKWYEAKLTGFDRWFFNAK